MSDEYASISSIMSQTPINCSVFASVTGVEIDAGRNPLFELSEAALARLQRNSTAFEDR
jgi:hypothetical protein